MANFILGYSDVGYLSTFSGGAWDANLPIEMLNDQLISAKAHSSGTTATIDITTSAEDAIDLQAFGIVGHNMTGGTYQITGYSGGVGAGQVYTSGAVAVGTPVSSLFNKTIVHAANVPYSVRYWRVVLTDGSNPDGYIKVGRIFLGKRLTSLWNADYGLDMGAEDNSTDVIESDTGILLYNRRPIKRTADFSLSLRSYELGDKFMELSVANGISGALLFELDPDNVRGGLYSFIGRSKNQNPLSFPNFNINEFSLSVEEII